VRSEANKIWLNPPPIKVAVGAIVFVAVGLGVFVGGASVGLFVAVGVAIVALGKLILGRGVVVETISVGNVAVIVIVEVGKNRAIAWLVNPGSIIAVAAIPSRNNKNTKSAQKPAR
jgi:hypothetical protein